MTKQEHIKYSCQYITAYMLSVCMHTVHQNPVLLNLSFGSIFKAITNQKFEKVWLVGRESESSKDKVSI